MTMNDTTPTAENLEFTDVDKAELAALGVNVDEPPTFHPILEVWREVLKPAQSELGRRINPAWANKITSSYRELNFRDMPAYRDAYFGALLEMAQILDEEIASDDDCLTYTTAEEDAKHNRLHYINMLTNWQLMILQWEMDWDCEAPEAPVVVAAISEVHKMFLGEVGLLSFLDNIGFEFDESDQARLTERLTEQQEGR
jgi:hypothetical protein